MFTLVICELLDECMLIHNENKEVLNKLKETAENPLKSGCKYIDNDEYGFCIKGCIYSNYYKVSLNLYHNLL